MYYSFCLIVPVLAGTLMFSLFFKEYNKYIIFSLFTINLLLSNIFTSYITIKFWDCYSNFEYAFLEMPAVGVKYCFISFLFTIILLLFVKYLRKVIRIEFEVVKNENN